MLVAFRTGNEKSGGKDGKWSKDGEILKVLIEKVCVWREGGMK